MRDFIFIIGTSGIGKTTLGKGLFYIIRVLSLNKIWFLNLEYLKM